MIAQTSYNVVSELSQSRRAPDMPTYIGLGKVDDLKGERLQEVIDVAMILNALQAR